MDDRDTIGRRIVDDAVMRFNKDNGASGCLFTTAHYGQAMKAEFRTPGPTLDGATCAEHLSQMGDLVEHAGPNLWRRKAQGDSVQSDITEAEAEHEPEIDRPEIGNARAEAVSNKFVYGYSCRQCHKPMDEPGPNHGVGADCCGTCDAALLKLESAVVVGIVQVLSLGLGRPSGLRQPNIWWSMETVTAKLRNILKDRFGDSMLDDGLLGNMVGLAIYAFAVEGKILARPNMLVDGARVTVFALATRESRETTRNQPPFKGSPDDESLGADG